MTTFPTRPLAATLALAFACAAIAPAASAQTSPQREVPKPSITVRALFGSADANHDGRVTRAEARGKLPLTYRDFDKIDTDKRGSITFEQFIAYTNQRAATQADDIVHIGARY